MMRGRAADLEAPLLSAESISPCFDVTFREMQLRKHRRRLHGTRTGTRVCRATWALAYVGALIGSLLCGQFDVDVPSLPGLKFRTGPAEMLLALILCIVTLGTAIRTVHQDVLWRWFSFWVYIGGLVLIETRDFQTMDDDDDNGGAIGADVASSMPMPRHELRLRAAAVLCVMLLLTLIGYVVLQHVLPHVELCLLAWLPRCAYRGSISASSGLPHGYGEWSDDATHGERLKGFWEDGVPTAPFASREYGSGHALGAVRVGYLANHGEPFHGPSPFRVRRLPGRQLRYGVSDVEAEVGGHYFRHCPFTTPRMEVRIGDGGADARLPAEKQKEKGLAEEDCGCEGEWWFREAAREAAAEMAKQAAAGDNARSVQRCLRLLASPTVDVRDGRSETQPLTEALLYLPGFNTPLGFSLQRMGQLLALARLPAHIAPFVFSWPGGREMSYLSASRATEEDWMASDLLALFEGLEANGVTKVHVLAHSMGARLLLSSLPRLLSSPAIASPGRLRLANIALLSPDFPLRAFETESVPFLRNLAAAHGTVTTIYGDRHDRPLGYGEVFNRLLRRPSEGWRSLGRLWPVRGLDCDVIDTTWMQAGLPAGDPDLAINTIMRHSHFTINQHVVDDLVECINTGSRAALRAGLERVQGGPSMEVAGCADVFRFHR